MKRSTIIIAAAALVIAAVIGFFVLSKNGLIGPPASNSIANIPKGDELSYEIKLHLQQKPFDHDEIDLYYIEGQFAAYLQESGELVSEWTKISDFKILAKPAPEAIVSSMINKPFVTKKNANNLEHHIGTDFPGRYLGLQLNILDKAWNPEPSFKDRAVTRQERDEFGQYSVQYSFTQASDGYLVTRQWLQSLDNKSVIDASDNQLVYLYNKVGQLQSVKGRLVINYKGSAGGKVDVFTTEFSMELQGQNKVAAERISRPTTALPVADFARAEVASQLALAKDEGAEAVQERIQNLEESLVRVDKFTRESPGSEQQEIFTNIKFGLMANPGDTAKVIDKIASIKATDDDAEARSALLFGAVTASGLPQVADSLAELAQTKCPDEFCKLQAVTSLTIHDHPSESNGKAMLSIAHSSKDDDLAGAAYMAAGSIAGKANGDSSEITQSLLADVKTAGSEDRKLAVIKAMGNHGSIEYLPVLENSAKSADSFEKSSALYSMRNISNDTVTSLLLGSIDVNGSDIVNVNALRALGQKPLAAADSMKLAQSLATSSDKDVQSALTDALLSGLRANATGAEDAINFLKEKASDSDLKVYLASLLKEIAEDKQKDANYEK